MARDCASPSRLARWARPRKQGRDVASGSPELREARRGKQDAEAAGAVFQCTGRRAGREFCERDELDLDRFGHLERPRPDRARVEREKAVEGLGAVAAAREEASQVDEAFRAVAGFFFEFASRGLLRRFAVEPARRTLDEYICFV